MCNKITMQFSATYSKKQLYIGQKFLVAKKDSENKKITF